MVSNISLHTMIFGRDAETVSRIERVLESIFPNSRFVHRCEVSAAVTTLDQSAFDLVMVVLEKIDSEHGELLEKIRTHASPMPVCLLLPSRLQAEFHQSLGKHENEWELIIVDEAEDATIERSVHLAISRHELLWERNHLQRAFRSSLLQYRSLFDEVPDIIFLFDRAGCILDVNATAERVFGIPKRSMMLRPVSETFGIDEGQLQSQVLAATDRAGTIEDVEIQFRPASGKVVYGLMHIILWQDAPDRPLQYQGVIKDISQRKNLESQLRQSELKYRTLYELAQVSSGSLQLETVAQESVELMAERCGASGAILLLNRFYDGLNLLAAFQFDAQFATAYRSGDPIQIGQGVAGRWAIGNGVRFMQSGDFDTLHPVISNWLDHLGAQSLVGYPVGRTDLSVPTSILLLAFDENVEDGPDLELFSGMTKTLEMGLNNCFHHSNAREAEAKYRELWEHAPAFFLSLLKGGVIFEINQTAAKALGYRLNEMIGRKFSEFIADESVPLFEEKHAEIFTTNHAQNYEVKLKKKDGGYLIASMNSEPLANVEGEVMGEKAVLYDITRDKELEASLRDYNKNLERKVEERTQELRDTMNFLDGILEGATEYAILGLDASGRIVHFNRGAQLTFHYDPEDIVGQHKLDDILVFDAADGGSLRELLESAEGSGAVTREVACATGDGREIGCHLTINRIDSEKQSQLAYVCIARDVTEQRRLEELLRRYTEDLERMVAEKTQELDQKQIELIQSSKLATLGEMATGVAHEMNQPLSGIRTKAQLLLRLIDKERATSDKIVFEQKQIIELVDRITSVIDHMLIFARQDEQVFGPFKVDQSVEACMNLLGAQLRLHGIEVDLEMPEVLPEVFGEPSQIEQVLLNLVGNARDAMDDKERVALKEGRSNGEYQKRLRIILECAGNDELMISVRDNGAGMRNDIREKIFEPFYTTKPVGEGTGLGLSISYGIISKHNGRIEVESEYGEGTEFKVYLPACKADVPAPTAVDFVNDTLREAS